MKIYFRINRFITYSNNNRSIFGPVQRTLLPFLKYLNHCKFKILSLSSQDDTQNPEAHGYQRVQAGEGTLSTSTTATSLDTIVIDDNHSEFPAIPPPPFSSHPLKPELTFDPILETEDAVPTTPTNWPKQTPSQEHLKTSKQSLKGSKVSFASTHDSSDEDSFEDKREKFQQGKTVSVDRRGILKVSKHGSLIS